MQVTISYDPHNADDMAKLAEMFSSTTLVAAKPQTGEAAESRADKEEADRKAWAAKAIKEAREEAEAKRLENEVAEKPAIDFKKRLKGGSEEAKLTERQKAEAEENTESEPVDLNTVKALAIEAIKAGKRDEVLAKLKELGSPTVTKLPAKHFDQMYDFLNALMAGA